VADRQFLRDLRNRCAAAACRVLDSGPRHAGAQHASDAGKALGVSWTALVATLGLRLSLTLPAAAVVVILARHRGEHVEQHAVDSFEHAAGELIAVAVASLYAIARSRLILASTVRATRVVPLCGNMIASTLGSTGVIISEKITFAERRLNTV
jgi:hypothetical protein